ncbi:hypothetical protein AVEN_260977-1, partial [Araneus ventricosus]
MTAAEGTKHTPGNVHL